MSPFTFKIGGEAGFGIMSAGLTFSKIATRSGYDIFDYTEYPSIVRGGHNVMQTTVATAPVGSARLTTELLVGLNQETVNLHQNEVPAGGAMMYDKEQNIDVSKVPHGVHLLAVPFNRLAREIGGNILMRNTVALGAAVAVLGGELQILLDLISEEFAVKKPKVVAKNHACAQAGYEYVRENYPNNILDVLKPRRRGKVGAIHELPLRQRGQIVVTGNEAVALGAIAAGMQFVSIYPMTPTSNILHVLAPLQETHGFIYKQPEDEIAAINMAIGASFAGARAMTATAGGGFSLMVEGYGLAGMTETPVVIIEGMRPGPATGLPTWTSQGDLRFMLYAHQDDFPRIVLAPGDAEEAFHITMQAFNLADTYQTPVVVMIDKYICESHWSVLAFEYKGYRVDRGKLVWKKQREYARYALSADGVSPRALPGTGNHIVANSDEHDEAGYSNEEAANRRAQMEKRMKKLETCRREDMPEPVLYGPQDADVTIVSWGSNKGPILDALKELPNVNYVHVTWMNPFPAEAMREILKSARKVVSIECNYSGQFTSLVTEKTGIKIKQSLLKYDGRPFYPEEIVASLRGGAIRR